MADIQGVQGLVETLKAEVERLKDQLAATDARASDEGAKTAQAINAFEALAQRLEAMAEAKHLSLLSLTQSLVRKLKMACFAALELAARDAQQSPRRNSCS
jgi:hypothetical protein